MLDWFKYTSKKNKTLIISGGVLIIVLIIALIFRHQIMDIAKTGDTPKTSQTNEKPNGTGGTHDLTGTYKKGDDISSDLGSNNNVGTVSKIKLDKNGARAIIKVTMKEKDEVTGKTKKVTKPYIINTDTIIYDAKSGKVVSYEDLKAKDKIKMYGYSEEVDTSKLPSSKRTDENGEPPKETILDTVITNNTPKFHYTKVTNIYRTDKKLYYVDEATKTRYVANRGVDVQFLNGHNYLEESSISDGDMLYMYEGKAKTGYEKDPDLPDSAMMPDYTPEKIAPNDKDLEGIEKTKDYKTVEIKTIYVRGADHQ